MLRLVHPQPKPAPAAEVSRERKRQFANEMFSALEEVDAFIDDLRSTMRPEHPEARVFRNVHELVKRIREERQ